MLQCKECNNRAVYTTLKLCNNHRSKYYGQVNRIKRTEYRKKYRLTKKGKEATQNAVRKYESTHPKRRNAWVEAEKIPMKSCIKCGVLKTHRHHPNIDTPLEFIYLCPLHHKQAHVV